MAQSDKQHNKGTTALKPTLSRPAMSDPKAVVAVYNTHPETEAGVKLQVWFLAEHIVDSRLVTAE